MSKYDPDYYDKNKDKMKASNKMWYEKNKEAILMKMKEQRLNRTPEQTEEARAKRREYYNNNKEYLEHQKQLLFEYMLLNFLECR